eukprot:gnl/Ergobibamus_cyprinoides/1372.p2 GENE.gnl/Ergobibamus_cyprinoides/1372~~gnl/Ergobibamus_cyprinoides/1372.p2  ORF type:complete len:168 (-),score=41.00 gnl/Ergobibamus_cyprinoides/1372:499-939(-)
MVVNAAVADRLYAAATKTGYLQKQGGAVKTWKKRWFTLCPSTFELAYFHSRDSVVVNGIIQLRYADVRTPSSLELAALPRRHSDPARLFSVVSGTRTYQIEASSPAERDEWLHAISEAQKRSVWQNPVAEGWLWKRGEHVKSWKRR